MWHHLLCLPPSDTFNMSLSNSMQHVANGKIYSFSNNSCVVFCFMSIPQFHCKLTCRHLSCYQVLFTLNNAMISINIPISKCINVLVVLGVDVKEVTRESYESSSFHFFRILQTVSYKDWARKQPHQWWMRVPLSPHSHKHCLFLIFDIVHCQLCEVTSHCQLDFYLPW